jgi:alkanesulfonate monooxygenase SsuD/methylene tetrahydromethanopterin reductase-like flavin-dependent oxidoreductase (luciferase family)
MATGPRFSLALPVHGVPFADTLAAARAAEAAGLEAVWVPDHLLNLARPAAGVLECWTTLSAVAAATSRIGVGTLVLTTPFREPALLALQAATLEAIAPGRLRLGLGAGGFTYDACCEQLGFERLPGPERVAHVEETVRCLRALWSEAPAKFEGRFARVRGAHAAPRPERAIPIALAALRPRMLALTARVADEWSCPLPSKLEAGLAALAAAGRRRETLRVSVYAVTVLGETDEAARRALARAGHAAQAFGDVETHHLFGDPDRAAARALVLARRGADEIVLDVRGGPVPDAVDLLAREVLPRVRAA